MNYKFVAALVSLSLVLLLTFSAVAYAGGHNADRHNADQLTKAGWTCFPAGPHDWVHCLKPGFDPTSEDASRIVKVFDVGGSPFLGTELLIRADLYHGQPCPQDNLDEFDLLPAAPVGPFPVAYRACHHFDTAAAAA